MLVAATWAAADGPTYKYRDSEGRTWLTDRPASGAQLDEMEFLGFHGRPPARHSCDSVADGEMERRVEMIAQPLTEYSRRFGVERTLARAIIAVESCYDPQAVSVVGAEGLMQLMPATARSLDVSNSFDIHQNLRAGIQYFRDLRERYNDDIVLALAAYNAGPGAVDRHGGIPPYPETERYVDRVLDRWNELRLNQR